MSEEEKFIRSKIEESTRLIEASSYIGNKKAYAKERTQFKCVLNLIQKQQEEIKEYEQTLDILDNRKYRKKYLEERRKEQKGLLYPDADEIYKRYYEQQKEIEELQKLKISVSAVNQIDNLQEEVNKENKRCAELAIENQDLKEQLEKKDKIITLMANYIYATDYRSECGNTREQVKQYFEREVERND